MRPHTLALLSLALTATATDAAILHDAFDYPPGAALPGQLAPNGAPWVVAGNATPAVNLVAGSLPDPAAAGQAFVRWGNSGNTGSGAATRVGIGTYNTGTVYWSLDFRVDDLTGAIGGTTGAYVAGLSATAPAQNSNITNAVARLALRTAPGDATSYLIGTSVNSNDGTATGPQKWDPTPRAAGVTYHLVAAYTFNPDANDDVAQLWIDPDPLTFGADTAPAAILTSTGADINAVAAFFLRQNQNSPASLSADDLRVDTTWAGVTGSEAATPEPALLAPALAATTLLRRRRR